MAKIRKIGNSYGIIIPASVLAAVGLHQDDTVTIEVTKTGFHVAPATGQDDVALEIDRFMQRYDRAMKRLATR